MLYVYIPEFAASIPHNGRASTVWRSTVCCTLPEDENTINTSNTHTCTVHFLQNAPIFTHSFGMPALNDDFKSTYRLVDFFVRSKWQHKTLDGK